MSQLQAALCCAFLLVATVSARPQVFNIGFNPNSQQNQQIQRNPQNRPNLQNPFLPGDNNSQNPLFPNLNNNQQLPQIDLNTISSTAAPVQSTTPSQAYFDCLNRCPTTSEYNPICGSDSVNYHNLGRLQCAAQCGRTVAVVRSGTCQPL